jgi:tight adherence protein B
MNLRLPLLLLLACFCLAGLAFTYLLIVRANEQRERIERRLSKTLRPHGGSVAEDTLAPMRVSLPVVKPSVDARIASLLGADLARRELYPAPWWLVALIALVPARLVSYPVEYLVGPVGMLAIPCVYWLICIKFFRTCHQRRVTTLFQQFPDALAMIVRAVRVGIPLTEAIRAVGSEANEPTATEFARLASEVSIGAPLDQALRAMAERNKVAEYRFFATALSLQNQTGGGISETLENLADVIRKRVAARARGRALAAEARASATALAILPVLAMGGLGVMKPEYIGVLFVTSTGHGILAAGTLLLGFGILAMRAIIQKSLS